MSVTQKMIEFLKLKYSSDEIAETLINTNLFSIASELPEMLNSEQKDLLILNRMWRKYHISVIKQLCSLFKQHEIKYIVFKGVALSYLLYNDPLTRVSSDIDVYVFQNDFERAYNLLEKWFHAY